MLRGSPESTEAAQGNDQLPLPVCGRIDAFLYFVQSDEVLSVRICPLVRLMPKFPSQGFSKLADFNSPGDSNRRLVLLVVAEPVHDEIVTRVGATFGSDTFAFASR